MRQIPQLIALPELKEIFARGFYAPDSSRVLNPGPALDALIEAFGREGYHEVLARRGDRLTRGPSVWRDPPSIHFDLATGEHDHARYVVVQPWGTLRVLLPVSHFAPVFSAVDEFHSAGARGRPRPVGARAVLAGWEALPEVRGVVAIASDALAKLSIRYLPWTSGELRAAVPLPDRPDATVRDLLFNFELHVEHAPA